MEITDFTDNDVFLSFTLSIKCSDRCRYTKYMSVDVSDLPTKRKLSDLLQRLERNEFLEESVYAPSEEEDTQFKFVFAGEYCHVGDLEIHQEIIREGFIDLINRLMPFTGGDSLRESVTEFPHYEITLADTLKIRTISSPCCDKTQTIPADYAELIYNSLLSNTVMPDYIKDTKNRCRYKLNNSRNSWVLRLDYGFDDEEHILCPCGQEDRFMACLKEVISN